VWKSIPKVSNFFPIGVFFISGVLYSSSPVTKWLYRNLCTSGPYFIAWRTSWEVWNPIGIVLCHIARPFPPPPFIFTCLICGESYTYQALRNNSSVHSVAVTQFCDTLILSSVHHHHHQIQHHLSSSSYPEKV
jgi:hypothetical protein